MYRDIYVGDLEKLPEVPMKMEDLRFSKILTKEQLLSIIAKVPAGFLTKLEAELLIHVVM